MTPCSSLASSSAGSSTSRSWFSWRGIEVAHVSQQPHDRVFWHFCGMCSSSIGWPTTAYSSFGSTRCTSSPPCPALRVLQRRPVHPDGLSATSLTDYRLFPAYVNAVSLTEFRTPLKKKNGWLGEGWCNWSNGLAWCAASLADFYEKRLSLLTYHENEKEDRGLIWVDWPVLHKVGLQAFFCAARDWELRSVECNTTNCKSHNFEKNVDYRQLSLQSIEQSPPIL